MCQLCFAVSSGLYENHICKFMFCFLATMRQCVRSQWLSGKQKWLNPTQKRVVSCGSVTSMWFGGEIEEKPCVRRHSYRGRKTTTHNYCHSACNLKMQQVITLERRHNEETHSQAFTPHFPHFLVSQMSDSTQWFFPPADVLHWALIGRSRWLHQEIRTGENQHSSFKNQLAGFNFSTFNKKYEIIIEKSIFFPTLESPKASTWNQKILSLSIIRDHQIL